MNAELRLILALLATLGLSACPSEPKDTGEVKEDKEETISVASVSLEELSSCEAFGSAIWTSDPTGDSPAAVLLASTVTDYCSKHLASEQAINESWEESMEAYDDALMAEDYPAACQALLAWEEIYAPHLQATLPQGSCGMQVYTLRSEAGVYEAGKEAFTTAWRMDMDLGEAILTTFDDCASVVDEESWDALMADLETASILAQPAWFSLSGSVTLEVHSDTEIEARGVGIEAQSNFDAATSLMDFSILATACEESGGVY